MPDPNDTLAHTRALQAQGLGRAAVARLATYLDVLAEWDRRVNLTGARAPEERVSLLVEPVLPVVGLVPAGTLIDVGSGNGSPGLVLALLRDDLEVTLLEPRARRWAFLREACRRAGRRVSVVRARHDAYPGPPARTVTLRALSLPLEQLAPLVAPGGRLIVMGARPALAAPFEEEEPGPERTRAAGIWQFRRPAVPRDTRQ